MAVAAPATCRKSSQSPPGRKGLQSEGEFDLPDFRQAARQLGILAVKSKIRVEAARPLERAPRYDEVAALHHRAGSGYDPAQQVNNVYASIKPCRDESSRCGKIVVDIGTTKGDQIGSMGELRERRLQPSLGEHGIGVDIGDVLALGRKASHPACLNQPSLGLVDDLYTGGRQSDPARAVGAPIIDDDYLGSTAGPRNLCGDRGEA